MNIRILRFELHIYNNSKLGIEARNLQFRSLQKVKDLLMHYTIRHSESYGKSMQLDTS